MARGRLVWKTEKLSSYTRRVADDTSRTARQLLTRGETILQRKVQEYTPVQSGTLKASVRTQHEGRWESVRDTGTNTLISVEGTLKPTRSLPRVGGLLHMTQDFLAFAGPARVLEGSVYSNLSYASDVEYDTGIYNSRNGNLPITPHTRRALAFVIGGRTIIVASVKGYRGKHMFAKAANFVDKSPTYLQNQSAVVLSGWRRRNMTVRKR